MMYLDVNDLIGYLPVDVWVDLLDLEATVADDAAYQALETERERLEYLLDNYDTNVESCEARAVGRVKAHLPNVYDLSLLFGNPPEKEENVTAMVLGLTAVYVARAGGMSEVTQTVKAGYDEAKYLLKLAEESRLNLDIAKRQNEDGEVEQLNTFLGGYDDPDDQVF